MTHWSILPQSVLACLLSAVVLAGASSAGNELLDAVKRRDTAAVRELLRGGADVNAAGPDGATPLHWAAHLGDLETAQVLISRGAGVNVPNRYGVTPIFPACTNGDAAIIELLLEAGADPNSTLAEGETALMTAARSGNLDAVRALLARGAEVNRKEAWRGQTALMWAAAEGHLEIVEKLIEQGAEVQARSTSGFTPFLFAVREGRIEVARALLKAGASVSEPLPSRLRRSTGAGEFSSDVTYSPIHLAVTNGHFELAAMLLEAGADPNAAEAGWTPLHTITWVRKPGGGSNDLGPIGSGSMDSLELVHKLVSHGADVNARMTKRTRAGASSLNMVGATPFLMAARTGDATLMRLLADLGADPLLPTVDDTTPLMVAAGVGTRSPGEDAGTESEVLEAVKVALELGNDIDAVDKNGETAMHGAAYKHLPGVVRFLADSGAGIAIWNRKNRSGWTPLRIAAGVRRGGNIRISEPTAEALRSVMAAAGESTVLEPATEPEPRRRWRPSQ